MDKYEYQVCTEQIKQLLSEKRFAEAMEIADTIDWRRVRSVSMLVTVSEIYKINKRYEDARDILLLAYEKHPTGKDIVYALCELAVKLNDIVQAVACYKEFCSLAPDDPNSCILLYKIYKAQDVSLEEQIDLLEEYKSKEYIEKWAYELASLYHKTGQEAKCVAACDELILWFGEGKYVRMAMELKMQHTALTPDQQAKYDGRAVTSDMPKYEQPYKNPNQFGNNNSQTGPMINQYAEYIQQTGDLYSTGQMYEAGQMGQVQPQYQDPNQSLYASPIQNPYMQQPQQDMYGQPVYDQNMAYQGYDNSQGYGQYNDASQPVTVTPDYYNVSNSQINVSADMNHLGMTQNIMVQSMGTGVWNTTDLQAQLAPQVMEVLSESDKEITAPPVQNTSEEVQSSGESNKPDEAAGELKEVKPGKEEKSEISVHTGVIDISSADLPGQELPRLNETSDIMSKLAGVIPGTTADDIKDDEADNDKAPDEKVSTGGHSVLTDTNERIEISPHLIKKEVPEDSYELISEEPKPENNKPEELKQEEIKPELPKPEDNEINEIMPEASKTEEPAKPEEVKPVEAEPLKQAEPEAVMPKDTVKTEDAAAETPAPKEEIPAENKPEENKFEVSEEIRKMNDKALGTKNPVEKTAGAAGVIGEVVRVSDEKGKYPYDTVADIGYVEEIPEIEQPDDIDDMLKTRDLPVDQIEAYERDSLPEVDEYDIDENDDDETPRFMRGNIRASREFDDDEYRIFCRYDGMESMKAQLVSAMDLMSMEPSHGNIAIMGPQSADCKGIAINLVKAMQSKNPEFSGKVAKISGEALNKKDIRGTLKKLENGALIVEGAGGLTKESILILTGVLSDEPEKVIVIIEGLKERIKPLFGITKQMKTVFDARIDIADFTDDDLVNYGRGYALEKEYFIDDMGGLALHNRISEMQTYDHKVTVDEVKELVDEAIRHVDKKNMGHFMDMLLGRRYDDEDNIILSEKDFEF